MQRIEPLYHPSCLFLEEVAELVHHATATVRGVRGGTVGLLVLVLFVVLVLVLLHSIFSKAAHDSTTDCSKDAVVGLVASETTGRTARESASNSTFTVLSTVRSTLVRSIGGIVSKLIRLESCIKKKKKKKASLTQSVHHTDAVHTVGHRAAAGGGRSRGAVAGRRSNPRIGHPGCIVARNPDHMTGHGVRSLVAGGSHPAGRNHRGRSRLARSRLVRNHPAGSHRSHPGCKDRKT